MRVFDWVSFLRRWSQAVLARDDVSEWYPPEIVATGWIGYAGATEEQITRAEVRLGTRLPPSYRAFLAVSNGWRFRAHVTSGLWLWPVEDIEWFAVRHREWIDAWMGGVALARARYGAWDPVADDDYLVYGARQDATLSFRDEYLETALAISPNEPDDSAIYLLNLRTITCDGEWETWFFADWLQGARRYQSFQEMMQAEYDIASNE